VLERCFADLERALAGERWCLIGAQAALCHGGTRSTIDVDISLLAEPADSPGLLARLAACGVVPRIADVQDFARRTRVMLLRHGPSDIPIDLVLAEPGLEEDFIAHAQAKPMFGLAIPVLAASDLVASKLFAGRPRDLDDVREVLRAAPVDPERVRDVLAVLEAALDRSDLLPVFEREWAARQAG